MVPHRSPHRAFPLLACAVFLLAGCADDRCDPQSSIPCSWTDDDECSPAPASCRHLRPEFNVLQLDVSTPLPVRLEVFRGKNYETGTLVWSGMPSAAKTALSQAAGDFSATALYVRGGDSVLVVDGVTLEAERMETCDGPCYGIGSAVLDLRLAK